MQLITNRTVDNELSPFLTVAPMRGRGFSRGGTNSRNDPFRSRPANTSRPPSMHVDDFVKMENQDGNANSNSLMGRRMDKVLS